MPSLSDLYLQSPASDDMKSSQAVSWRPKRILDEKRSEANRRERGRVQALTDRFDQLFHFIPREIAEPRLARIEIVRRAVGYIRFLTELVESERPEGEEYADSWSAWGAVPADRDDLDSSVLRKAYLNRRGGVKLLPMKRVECNARARTRSKETKDAFLSLKRKLPLHGTEPELSRLEILRRATDYIACMTKLLAESEAEGEIHPTTTFTPSTPSTPGENDFDRRSYLQDHERSASSSGASSGTYSSSSTMPGDHRSARSCPAICHTVLKTPATPSESGYDTSLTSPRSMHSETTDFLFDDRSSSILSETQTHRSPCVQGTREVSAFPRCFAKSRDNRSAQHLHPASLPQTYRSTSVSGSEVQFSRAKPLNLSAMSGMTSCATIASLDHDIGMDWLQADSSVDVDMEIDFALFPMDANVHL